VCFDNLSRLPEELADAACRLTTGGFGGRQLYNDHDEAIFDATRPLVFNAIPELGTARPDFLDRVLIVEFLSMPPEMRRDAARYWSEFPELQPRILGALLDAAVAALRNLPQVKLERPPRLADFALWVTACEEALGMQPGEVIAACREISPRRERSRLRPPRFTNRWPNWPGRALPGPSQNFACALSPLLVTSIAAQRVGQKPLTC
jgi:hypothetical protein